MTSSVPLSALRREREGMTWIPGGSFLMGSEDFYPEERPVRSVELGGFWIDERLVTVAAFRRFVKHTGYVTVAERPLDPAAYPGADPAALVPAPLVFHRPAGPVDLRDYRQWWAYVPGATWNRPEGPGSDTYTRARHPVTQVAFEDAQAYAAWAGKALPTEAEWERAARGGLEGAAYAWGDDAPAGGGAVADCWRGGFPGRELGARVEAGENAGDHRGAECPRPVEGDDARGEALGDAEVPCLPGDALAH